MELREKDRLRGEMLRHDLPYPPSVKKIVVQNHLQGYPSIHIFRKGSDVKEDHGHHDHESYYGVQDTDTLVKTMEDLVAPISLLAQNASEHPSSETKNDAKRPAPVAGGCRIEGFVRVKKVPGNLVISARSAAHSFDASQMNMSHVIAHFSFGKMISPRVMNDIKGMLLYLGRSYDRLNGLSYISNPSDSNANVTVLINRRVEVLFSLHYKCLRYHRRCFYGCWNLGLDSAQHIQTDEKS